MTDTVTVPREATDEMWAAGERAFSRDPDTHHETVLANIWDAMLAAAPKAEPVSDPYKLEPLLWSMHVLGPDDVYPAPDLETAFKWCEYVNTQLAPRTPDVLCAAIPALWDGTPEQHAKSLPDAIKGWTVPAHPEAPKVEQEPVAWRAVWRDGSSYGEPRNWPPIEGADTYHGLMGRTIQPLYPHPAPASDELLEAATALVGIVEGVGVLNHGKWSDEHGLRLKDTPEWVAFYIAKHKGPQS